MAESSPHEKGLLIALVNSAEGRDDEFNDWYTNTHLPEVVALPGIHSAQRYRVPDVLATHLPHRYATVYEVDDPAATMNLLFAGGFESSDSIDLTSMIFSAFLPLGAPILPRD